MRINCWQAIQMKPFVCEFGLNRLFCVYNDEKNMVSRVVDCALLDDADTLVSILYQLENIDAEFRLSDVSQPPILQCSLCFTSLPALFGAPACFDVFMMMSFDHRATCAGNERSLDHFAAAGGNFKIARELVALGHNFTARDSSENTSWAF
jgi:hypothetical protein